MYGLTPEKSEVNQVQIPIQKEEEINVPDVIEEKVIARPEGCSTCNNTGFEPNVARSEAKLCPDCKGHPFIIYR